MYTCVPESFITLSCYTVIYTNVWRNGVMCFIVDCLLIIVGDLAWTIVKGPLEAVVGIVYGIVCGIILWYLPDSKHVSLILLLTLLRVVSHIC